MTKRLSTGLANSLVGAVGFAAAFAGGVIDIYSGSQPATADSAISGTLLGRVSIASATYAAETPASATITLAGASGSINTLNIGTFNIIPLGAVNFITDLATTAQALCDAINRNGIYRATYPGSGAVVTVIAPAGTGAAHNGLALAATVTTMTATSSGNITGGVAATAGITFGVPVGGVVSKTGVWSFNGLAPGGTAGWFRMKASAADADGASTTLVRLDGSVAVSGADMNLSNLVITTGAPTTIDSFTVTMPLA